jgi:hypothetical protein
LGGSSSGGKNVGAIVGGVIGGVSFILACVALFWFLRRQRNQKKTKKATELDVDDDEDGPQTMRQNELPQNYQPDPFVVREHIPSEFDEEYSTGRPFSPRTSFYTRSDTPDLASTLGMGVGGVVNGESTGTSRKGGAPRPMRAVNIVQHQDAGPSNNEDREDPAETIELPPAYTMVRTQGGGTSGGGGDDPST